MVNRPGVPINPFYPKILWTLRGLVGCSEAGFSTAPKPDLRQEIGFEANRYSADFAGRFCAGLRAAKRCCALAMAFRNVRTGREKVPCVRGCPAGAGTCAALPAHSGMVRGGIVSSWLGNHFAMANGTNVAFSRILIDRELAESRWGLRDPGQVQFEFHYGHR
jgi:hypothetical protein